VFSLTCEDVDPTTTSYYVIGCLESGYYYVSTSLPASLNCLCKIVVGTTCGNSTTALHVIYGFVNKFLV
jgi:hypothetical protein